MFNRGKLKSEMAYFVTEIESVKRLMGVGLDMKPYPEQVFSVNGVDNEPPYTAGWLHPNFSWYRVRAGEDASEHVPTNWYLLPSRRNNLYHACSRLKFARSLANAAWGYFFMAQKGVMNEEIEKQRIQDGPQNTVVTFDLSKLEMKVEMSKRQTTPNFTKEQSQR